MRALVLNDAGGIKTVAAGGVADVSFAGFIPRTRYERPDTSGAPQTTFLPPNPKLDETVIVIDIAGNAGTNPITVDGSGNTINGAATNVLSVNYAAATYVFSGTEWNITI